MKDLMIKITIIEKIVDIFVKNNFMFSAMLITNVYYIFITTMINQNKYLFLFKISIVSDFRKINFK